jgi:hypothetical protein
MESEFNVDAPAGPVLHSGIMSFATTHHAHHVHGLTGRGLLRVLG